MNYLLIKKSSMIRQSNPQLKKVRIASFGVQTIGSPFKLNEVFNIIGTPDNDLKCFISK